jgi:hypothetical protein
MTDQFQPVEQQPVENPPAGDHHTVTIGGVEMTLAEARAQMSPALGHQMNQQYARADDTPALAQQLVDAYAAAHEAQTGEAWAPVKPEQPEPEPPPPAS